MSNKVTVLREASYFEMASFPLVFIFIIAMKILQGEQTICFFTESCLQKSRCLENVVGLL